MKLEEAIISYLKGDLDQERNIDFDRFNQISDSTYWVTNENIVSVMIALRESPNKRGAVQKWASFVRRGYPVSSPRKSIKPLNIDWDDASSPNFVDVLGRLDELGDTLDGEISAEELDSLIKSLE